MDIIITTPEQLKKVIRNIINEMARQLPQKQEKDLLSYEEGAKLLDIKTATLARQVNDGLYDKHISASGKPYVSRKEILSKFE